MRAKAWRGRNLRRWWPLGLSRDKSAGAGGRSARENENYAPGLSVLPIDLAHGTRQPLLVELETVFETFNAAEAQLIRSRLAAAGIETEMDPEIDPLSIGGGGSGVRIKVSTEQAAEARALLATSAGESGPE